MDILNVVGTVLFTSVATTIKDVLIEAVRKGANLRSANLRSANLYGADLYGANLYGADLYGADLYGADLRSANLYGADLRSANLYGADLYGADLRSANLYGANLYGADLYGADLRSANLYGANLYGADLREVKNGELAIAQIQFIPETGAFDGWKKCKNGVIVKLAIPATAKRSHGAERKCRASEVEVLEVFGADEGVSSWDSAIIYRKGEKVVPSSFSDDRWDVCAPGIHFFLTRVEAENYNL